MKTYVVSISRTFPATHPRKGEPTGFREKILNELIPCGLIEFNTVYKHGLDIEITGEKIHTIRANYDFWRKRIEQVWLGEAELSLRYWSGKPRHSKQVEFLRLGKDDGVGIQKVEFKADEFGPLVDGKNQFVSDLAKNDGLSLTDFTDWFKGYDLSKPLAIIHFTKFRY